MAEFKRAAGVAETRDQRWAVLSSHREGVLLSLRRRFGDFPDAEDVVDEAMLRLVDLPDLECQRVPALLYTVAHNLNIDRHRRGARHRRLAARLRVERSESADDVVVAREQLRQALRCVSSLSAKEQQALAGRVLGYRPAETAELLGVSTTSVYQALSRARTALRSALGGAAALVFALRRLAGGLRVAGASASTAAGVTVALSLAITHPWVTPAKPSGVASVTVPAAVTAHAPMHRPAPQGHAVAGGTVVVFRPAHSASKPLRITVNHGPLPSGAPVPLAVPAAPGAPSPPAMLPGLPASLNATANELSSLEPGLI